MNDDRRKPAESARLNREQRLAAALRANLWRRKAAAGKPADPPTEPNQSNDRGGSGSDDPPDR